MSHHYRRGIIIGIKTKIIITELDYRFWTLLNVPAKVQTKFCDSSEANIAKELCLVKNDL